MTIFSILAIISFVLNFILLLERHNKRKNLKNEIAHEDIYVHSLDTKIQEMIDVCENTEITDDEKIKKLKYLSGYCKGLVTSEEVHVDTMKHLYI